MDLSVHLSTLNICDIMENVTPQQIVSIHSVSGKISNETTTAVDKYSFRGEASNELLTNEILPCVMKKLYESHMNVWELRVVDSKKLRLELSQPTRRCTQITACTLGYYPVVPRLTCSRAPTIQPDD